MARDARERPRRCCWATRPTAPARTDSCSAVAVKAVIPEPSDQAGHRKRKGSSGGRSVGRLDVLDYKHRNVLERCFNTLKNWRGLATRYDKKVLVYRGGVVLASMLMWLS